MDLSSFIMFYQYAVFIMPTASIFTYKHAKNRHGTSVYPQYELFFIYLERAVSLGITYPYHFYVYKIVYGQLWFWYSNSIIYLIPYESKLD